MSKILFLPLENKIHTFKPPCKDKDKVMCEIMENKPLGSQM